MTAMEIVNIYDIVTPLYEALPFEYLTHVLYPYLFTNCFGN
jgi:hypothetical protein